MPKKALNRIKHIIDSSKVPNNFDSEQYLEDMKCLTNALEVLEIIEKKEVEVFSLCEIIRCEPVVSYTYYQYCCYWKNYTKEQLTEDEFNKVKSYFERRQKIDQRRIRKTYNW